MASRSRALLFVPIAMALVAGSLAAREAHAESAPPPPRCRVALLPAGTSVPANLPAMVVDDSRTNPGLTSTIEIGMLVGKASSVRLGKVPDPRTPNVTLLVPPTNDPLEIGVEHSLAYTFTCSNTTETTSQTATFKTGPAVALPTRIGAVRELADGTAVITPSSELSAFLPTTRFEVFVGGESVGLTRYGALVAYEGELAVRASAFGLSFGGEGAYAGGTKPLCAANAAKERHEVKVVAHVAGTDADTDPLSFAVEVDCSTPPAAKPIVPDGGGDDRGASGGSDDAGGCAVTTQDPIGSLLAMFTAGAGLAVLLRRRRR